MTPKTDEHSLLGAYATDALSDVERARFERHLELCHDCIEELRGFLETTARLASAVSAVPPDTLKQATLSAAARTRQLSPPAAPVSRVVGRVRRHSREKAATARGRIAGLAAATIVLAVAAGVFVDTQPSTDHSLRTAQRNNAIIEKVLTAPDATLVSSPVATGGTAHVVMSASTHACLFSASSLRPLTGAKRYELWLIRRGRDEPSGTLPVNGGTVGPVSMGGIQPGDVLGISVEPAGGSLHPTTPMILELAL